MKKSIFKISIICLSILLIVGVTTLSGERDEPGPIGGDVKILHFI